MSRKRRGKSCGESRYGRCKKQRVLSLILCMALVFGGICVPEGTVQAAETKDASSESSGEEATYTPEENNSTEELSSSLEENYPSWDAADVSGGDGVSDIAATALSLSSTKDDIAGGTYENITWRIDANGTLTVEGTGEFSAYRGSSDRAPWYWRRENIKSAVVRVSGLRDASSMFDGCSNLTSLDVSGFDTSSVTSMSSMFRRCSNLTSLDVSGFDTSSVTNMTWMFWGCSSLTSLDLSGFDTSSVTNMTGMFWGCSSLTSLDLSGFDTSNVTNMSHMFYICRGLTSLDVSGFDTSSVTSMESMFGHCSSLTSLDVSGFDTSSVTSMSDMFYICSSLTSLDVSGFDTSSVTSMNSMFRSCSSLTSLDVSGFDTSSVTDMYQVFWDCSSLTNLDVSGFDTSSVTSMSGMFSGCSSLISLDVSGFDTSSATSMSGMFSGCSSLTSLDVSGFDTSSVTSMDQMFANCRGLTSLDVSGFDTSSVTSMGGMVSSASSLSTLYTPYNVTCITALPTEKTGDAWYDVAGNAYTVLPKGLDHSIVLAKNKTPEAMQARLTVQLAKTSYEPGSVIHPEDLTVKYRGTDGRTITLSYQGEDAEVSGYTMSAVDMNTPGTKTLTISYNDGTSTLTESVTFTVSALLADVMVTLPEGEYVYNGRMQKPVPVVKSAEGTVLTPGRDYTVSYMDNRDAGEATLSVKGRKAYSGTVSKTFTIQKASLKDIEVTFSELCREAQENRIQNLSDYFDKTAPNSDGITGYTIGEVVEYNTIENGEGSVLAGGPSIDEAGVLTYSTNAGTAGDTVLIPVTVTFAKNYKDALINITICLKDDRMAVSISGITMQDSVYNGSPVFWSGAVTVHTAEGTDVTESVTLMYCYSGTQADGTVYDSDMAPTHAGSYTLTVTVAENASYKGSAEYPFVIGKAPLTVIASDVELVIGTFDTLPDESTLTYEITGFCRTDTAQDVLSTLPVVAYGLNGKKIDKASIAIDKAGSYELIPAGAVLNRTVGADYEITAQSYQKGTLTIAESSSIDPDKTAVSISGITMQDSVYNGSPVFWSGAAMVHTAEGTDVTESVILMYRYSGTQADGTVYDSDTAPTHAGSYVLAVTVAENASYKGSAEYPFVIGKAPLTITASDVALEIGTFDVLPDESTLTYEITGFCGTHMAQDALSTLPTVAYGLNGESIDKASIAIDTAGSYDLIPSGAVLNQTVGADYELTAQSYQKGTLTIAESSSTDPDDPKDPDDPQDSEFPDDGKFRIIAVPDQTYTGRAIKPAVVVYCGSRRLTEKTDYTVTYKNNIKVNDATVRKSAPTITVTGKGNYRGKQSITFVIEPKDITKEDVTAAELIAAQSNKVQKPVPTLTWNGKKLKNKKDFTVSYPDENKSGAYQTAGNYTVVVNGKGNYSGKKILIFTITDKTLLTKAKVTVKAKDYAGSAVTLNAEDITVKVGKITLVYGTDYTLSYRNNTQAGKATVIVTGTGDRYEGSKEATFQIKGESLAKAQITGVVNKTYTGTAQTQNIQVQLSGKTLQEGADYTVSYAKEVNAGTASVIVTGKGGYTGTAKKSFKIMAYDLQADEAGKVQGVPKNLTTACVKGGAMPTLTLTFDGKTLEAKKDYTVTYQNNKKPGAAADAKAPVMIVKGKGNFKGTISIPFTIEASNLEMDGNVTITAADTAYVNKPGKYAVKPVLTDANGKKLTAGTDYEKTFTYALVNADGTETALTKADIVPKGGIVKVTATGKGSYTGKLSATYHITKASFSKAKITVKPQIYTGAPVTLSEKDVTVKIGGSTLTYGKDYTIVPGSYRNNTKKGTATVTIKGMDNYGGSKTVKFKIKAKPLTTLILETLKH